MATSQNTWGSPSVAGVKEFSGDADCCKKTGGDYNPTPGVAGKQVTTRSYKVETAGWKSPNGESDQAAKGGYK